MTLNPFVAIGEIISRLVDAYRDNRKIKAAVDERKDVLRKLEVTNNLERIAAGEKSDIAQDDQARGFAGWMDDISFFLGFLPLVLAFYPPAVPHITKGFEVIAAMPVVYQWFIGLMLASVWGYKRLITPIVVAVTKTYIKRLG